MRLSKAEVSNEEPHCGGFVKTVNKDKSVLCTGVCEG